MTDQAARLQFLTQFILTADHPGELRAACFELYELYSAIAEFSDADPRREIQNGTILPSGKAISPVNAARCLWDYKRTCEFLRGVRAALGALKTRFPHEKIEILYAGCGPFAPLIVPLLERFSPDELALTLIDYHAASIDSAKKIFEKLDLMKYSPEFIRTDAANYRHARRLHLVICETMQTMLANETQTAITLNLAPQLHEKGIFVPEKITVELCLANFGKEVTDRERIDLGTIFQLEAEAVRRTRSPHFPPVALKIPPAAQIEKLHLMVLTKIRVFDAFRLDDYDSSLTYPSFLRPAPSFENVKALEFSYLLDDKPRFEYKIMKD